MTATVDFVYAGALYVRHLARPVRFTYTSATAGTYQVTGYLHGVRHTATGTILFTHGKEVTALGDTMTVHSVEHDTPIDFTDGGA